MRSGSEIGMGTEYYVWAPPDGQEQQGGDDSPVLHWSRSRLPGCRQEPLFGTRNDLAVSYSLMVQRFGNNALGRIVGIS